MCYIQRTIPDLGENGYRSDLFANRAELFLKAFDYENVLTEIESAEKYFANLMDHFILLI